MQTNARPRRRALIVVMGSACCWLARAAAQDPTSGIAAPVEPPAYHAKEVAAAPVDPASPNESLVQIRSSKTDLNLVEKFAKVISLDAKIARVDGFDPEVVVVSTIPMRPNQIRVLGNKPGVTTMVLVDENDKSYTIEVFVTGDVRHLQAYIDRLFPRSSVKAIPVRDSVVLQGWVEQPEHITELVELAQQFSPKVLNHMKVGAVQQVLLKVKVMEVQRSKIRALGVNWNYVGDHVVFSSTPGSLVPLTSLTAAPGGSPALTPSAASLTDTSIIGGFVDDNNALQVFIDALKEESLLKILAEPTLVATNGHPAQLLSGGEFPILVPQGLQSVTIEYREFGVRLEAIPTILGGGRVRLELQPEVSERDFTNAVSVNGFLVPGLTTRRVNTEVEMRYGETFVLAGLLSTQERANTEKIPFLGELPWIGTAFSRKRYEEAETEVVIMVTPELVAPLNCGDVPPGGPGRFSETPTDRELYHSGYIEVPYYGDRCDGPNCGPQGPGLLGPHGPLGPSPVIPAAEGEASLKPIAPPSGTAPEAGPPPGGEPSAGLGSDLREKTRALFYKTPRIPAEPAPEGAPPATGDKTAERTSMIEPKPGLITPPGPADPFAPGEEN